MTLRIDKGSALLILLLVASAIAGVGVVLDGEVLPSAPDTEALLEKTQQASLAKRSPERVNPAVSPEVAQQLRRAVDAANRSDEESAIELEAKIATSKTKMEEINRIVEEKKGDGPRTAASSEKAQQFEARLDELSARLKELRPSN